MVDVEQQFERRRADLLDDFNAIVGMVSLIPGMSLHFAIDAAVEHFQTQRHLLLFRMSDDLLETIDAIPHSHVVRDVFAKSGECNHARTAELTSQVDHRSQPLEARWLIFRVVHSLLERMAARDGARQPVFLEHRPVFRRNELDAGNAKLLGDLTSLFDGPVLVETPLDDRLSDVAAGDGGWLVVATRQPVPSQAAGRRQTCRPCQQLPAIEFR